MRVTTTFALALALLCGLAPAAGADPPASATIVTDFTLTSPPGSSVPPVAGAAEGTFTISGAISDSGTADLQLIFGALPAPSTGVLQSVRTLVGHAGTITLRCHQIAKDFSNLAHVPNSGSCAVIGGTGAYSGLHGHGQLTGYTQFPPGGAPSVHDTLELAVT